MAEVIVEAARDARRQSRRLRSEGAGLKLLMRSRARTTEERSAKAEAAVAILYARRAVPFASPWSGLEWFHEDESLERTLLPVD